MSGEDSTNLLPATVTAGPTQAQRDAAIRVVMHRYDVGIIHDACDPDACPGCVGCRCDLWGAE